MTILQKAYIAQMRYWRLNECYSSLQIIDMFERFLDMDQDEQKKQIAPMFLFNDDFVESK